MTSTATSERSMTCPQGLSCSADGILSNGCIPGESPTLEVEGVVEEAEEWVTSLGHIANL